jgi:hypothetical protein
MLINNSEGSFEYIAWWFIPQSPEKQYVGRLFFSYGEEITLEIYGNIPKDSKTIDCLWGQEVASGAASQFTIHSLTRVYSHISPANAEHQVNRFFCELVFRGGHFFPQDKNINYFCFSSQTITRWLGHKGLPEREKDLDSDSKIEIKQIFECNLEKVKIIMRSYWQTVGNLLGSSSTKPFCSIELIFSEFVNIDEIIKLFINIKTFFGLVIGFDFFIKIQSFYIKINNNDRQNITFFGNYLGIETKTKVSSNSYDEMDLTYFSIIPFDKCEGYIESMINNWFNKNLWNIGLLLSESHEEKILERKFETTIKCIEAFFKGPWCKERSGFSSIEKLKERLENLINESNDQIKEIFDNNVNKVCSIATSIRNELTHPRHFVIDSPSAEIGWLNRFFLLLILQHIFVCLGIPQDLSSQILRKSFFYKKINKENLEQIIDNIEKSKFIEKIKPSRLGTSRKARLKKRG